MVITFFKLNQSKLFMDFNPTDDTDLLKTAVTTTPLRRDLATKPSEKQ